MSQVHAAHYFHDIPKESISYFLPLPEDIASTIAIVIPFYNEKWIPLTKTISSLEACQEFINTSTDENISKYTFTYCLIQDGWINVSEDMKEKLIKMFPHNYYWNELENWNEEDYYKEEGDHDTRQQEDYHQW